MLFQLKLVLVCLLVDVRFVLIHPQFVKLHDVVSRFALLVTSRFQVFQVLEAALQFFVHHFVQFHFEFLPSKI